MELRAASASCHQAQIILTPFWFKTGCVDHFIPLGKEMKLIHSQWDQM